jgi:diguanylate cyclase (GGDEF)-like protein
LRQSLHGINRQIELLPVWLLSGLALTGLGIIGFLDYFTGPDYSFSVFYLVIVVASAWYQGRKSALLVSVAGTAVWFAAAIASREYADDYPLSLFWNDLVELTHFLFAVVVISTLKALLDASEKTSRIDPLTGIANRRLFYEVANTEIVRAHRTPEPFTIMYIDIDNFKTVNDTQGHDEGDLLLIAVASTIRHQIRESDTVARLGGDEFSVLLPLAAKDAAEVAGRKLKRALADAVETRWPVTFSIGMVTYTTAPESVECMIRQADQVMYEAKKSGKNELRSVEIHPTLPPKKKE